MIADAMARLVTLADQAREAGRAVGAVSTVYLSHATPGAWFTHNDARGNGFATANEDLWRDPNTTGPLPTTPTTAAVTGSRCRLLMSPWAPATPDGKAEITSIRLCGISWPQRAGCLVLLHWKALLIVGKPLPLEEVRPHPPAPRRRKRKASPTNSMPPIKAIRTVINTSVAPSVRPVRSATPARKPAGPPGERVACNRGPGVGLRVAVRAGVGKKVAVAVSVGRKVGSGVIVGVSVAVGVAVGVGEGPGVGEVVRLGVGERKTVAVRVGVTVGVFP